MLYHISLHIKHPQSISPIFSILFLNSNIESLDCTTTGRLLHMREPQKYIVLHSCHSKIKEFLVNKE